MKEALNQIKYTLKGELTGIDSGVVTALKKEEEDSIDLNAFFEDVKNFAEANKGKVVDCQFVLKATE